MKETLDTVLRYNHAKLRKRELGDVLAAAAPDYKIIGDLAQRLSEIDLQAIPDGSCNNVATSAETVAKHYAHIIGINETDAGQPTKMADNALATGRLAERFYDSAAPVLALSYAADDRVAALEAELRAELKKMKMENDGHVIEMLEQTSGAARKLEASIEVADKMANSQAVAKHAQLFKIEAGGHLVASHFWLGATIFMVLVTLGYALNIGLTTEFTLVKVLKHAAPRLFALSVFGSTTVWFSRLYRANRHNYVVNQQRHNALGTFEAFARGAQDDPATKNALLLQASTAIFAPQSSGYAGGATDSPSMQTQVLEIVRGARGGGTGPG